MQRLLIACLSATFFAGIAAAHAAPAPDAPQPVGVRTATLQPDDLPYMLARLREDIRMLRTEVQSLGGSEGQSADGAYYLSAGPAPNPGGAPIPSGG